ncbi:MAG: HDOD domain-containing protein [Pseudomonadota bacterium]
MHASLPSAFLSPNASLARASDGRLPDRVTVVFVDDETAVLNGITRNLSRSRKTWDVHGFDDPNAALDFIAMNPVDVVVSDMRMPKMNGIDFLTNVMGINSDTVRIALSGFASFESTLESLKMVHRFIAKPVKMPALVDHIERSMALQGDLRDRDLYKLLLNLDTLPSNPRHQGELRQLAASASSNAEELCQLIENDVGLTANLIRVVNSECFGHCQGIESVSQAVELLGLQTIKNLVLSNALYSQVQSADGGAFEALTRSSNGVSTLSRKMATACELDPAEIDRCELAGMLTTLGDIVLLANRHTFDQASEVRPERLAGAILKMWMFSDPIVEAVVGHRTPISMDRTAPLQPITLRCVTAAWLGWQNLTAQDTAKGERDRDGLRALFLQLAGDADVAARWTDAVANHPN